MGTSGKRTGTKVLERNFASAGRVTCVWARLSRRARSARRQRALPGIDGDGAPRACARTPRARTPWLSPFATPACSCRCCNIFCFATHRPEFAAATCAISVQPHEVRAALVATGPTSRFMNIPAGGAHPPPHGAHAIECRHLCDASRELCLHPHKSAPCISRTVGLLERAAARAQSFSPPT